MKSNINALILGLLAYAAVYGLKYGYETVFFSIESIGPQNRWFSFAPTVLALMLLVLPAYISGLLVGSKGALIGFLVAAIGFSVRFFLLSAKWRSLPMDLSTVLIWIEQMLVPVTVGAVSGAAGQLQRIGSKEERA